MLPTSFLTTFLLLAAAIASAEAPPTDVLTDDTTGADLVQVFACRFDEAKWDINYDAWPDRWTRVYDDEHPQYVRMQIEAADDHPQIERQLTIRPDGAAATAISPPIHVASKFSYRLKLRVRLAGAEHGKASVRLVFYAGETLRQTEESLAMPSDGEWHDLVLGDYRPQSSDIDRVYIEIDYERGARGDLAAEVAVADLQFFRLPSIRIETGSRYNVYTDKDQVKVTCHLSGILKRNPEVRFQLFDATNRFTGEGWLDTIDGKLISESSEPASEIVDGFETDKSSYEGTTEWNPPIKDYGFYRVRVGMFNRETQQPIGASRSITLAVVRPDFVNSEDGEFGWSLPQADRPLSFDVLQDLLPRVGVRMVKLPVWFAPEDEARGDALLRFAEQLSVNGIETIGVLEDPTGKVANPTSSAVPPPIEGLLSTDPSYWTPLIDHVITRLSMRIRWWQLGRDGDTSFVGHDDLVTRLTAIRNQMFRFGQDIRMGIGWRWDHLQSWATAPIWDFEQLAQRERLDAAGLAEAFDSAPPARTQRWVLVEPPDVVQTIPEGADPNDPEDPLLRQALVRRHQQRVRDFVEQILVAKVHGANGIFVADPFVGAADASRQKTGVMNEDGTPGELLLPWRTCARLLGGADYLGSIQLPNRSENWLFRRPDGKLVMVLWNLSAPFDDVNATPIEEVLYLGEEIESIDAWGSSSRPIRRGHRQVIPVGRMPRFVLGLNEAIARWRMETKFETTAIPSVFGLDHPNALTIKNTFGQGAGGRFEVVIPELNNPQGPLTTESIAGWNVLVDNPRLTLTANQQQRLPLRINLNNVDYGDQPARIDFTIEADRAYQFSVWRDLHVGLEGVQLEVETSLDPDGRLVVEQRMRQVSGTPSDFKCLLYAPGTERRRKRAHVFQLGEEVNKKLYIYRNSEDLIGRELRLQIEEVDGSRMLIHRFRVVPIHREEVGPTTDEVAVADDIQVD